MPAMRTYKVTETRTLEVRADSPATAMLVGALRLDRMPNNPALTGSVTRVPRVVGLEVEEI